MQILEILESKGIDYEHKGGDEWAVTCPHAHLHDGGVDNHKSFNVNVTKRVAGCFACGFKLNEAGLHRWLLGEELDEFQELGLQLRGILSRLNKAETVPVVEEETQVFFPSGDPIDFDYRGISPEFYAELGGVVPKRGRYGSRLCFPVMLNGKLIGVDGRALEPGMEPRYLRNKNSTCGQNWLSFYDYNKELIKRTGSDFIILAEGMWHSIRPLSYGIPATCFFGANNMSDNKVLMLLALGVSEVVYFPDLDTAGWEAQIKVTQMLLPWFKVTWPDTSRIQLDVEASERKGKPVYFDLGDLNEEEIRWALENKNTVRMRGIR